MTELITSTVSAAITAILTFILTRRKYHTEVKKADKEADSSEIDNVEKAIRIWRQLSEDIKVRLTQDIEELRLENLKTREKLNTLTRENHALRHQMTNLEKELNLAKLENEKLHKLLKQ
ncbi:MAG TPA: hypothetical protein VK212_03495 [Lentimicrobium sp.]|nr:hypothetical protein [Lentimicrobium sp.]